MTHIKKQWLLLALTLTVVAPKAYAVRPFITDDAMVIDDGFFQLESWALVDNFSGQHWNMLAYGPYQGLEVAVGAVWGYHRPQPGQAQFSYATPLLEAKYLFRGYDCGKFPGVALAGGSFLPGGKGGFVAPGYGAYGYMAVTQCFGQREDVLIHGNIGGNYLYADQRNQFLFMWGLGVQLRVYEGFHLVGEMVAGDPYVPDSGFAYHVGFRHFISDFLQIDASVGQGMGGRNRVPLWVGMGARVVMPGFGKKP